MNIVADFHNFFFNLFYTNFKLFNYQFDEDKKEIHLFLEPKDNYPQCPICKNHNFVVHEYRHRIVKDGSYNGFQFILHITYRTFKCKFCDKYATEQIPFISSRHRITKSLENEVIEDLQRSGSIKDDCGNDIWVISDILVEKNLKYRGIRALLSDCEKDPCVCYQRYYDRAEVEYAFNTLKYRLACNRPRCHKDKSLSGRLFTQFIATTLSIMVRKRLQKYKKAVKNKVIKGKIIYSSDGKLLSSLNNILVKVTPEGNLYDEVVGKKADYFIALGIPLPSSTPQGFDPLSGLMDEQEAENDLDKLDPILDGLYYEEI